VGGLIYTASRAQVSDDLRRIDLEDARLTRRLEEVSSGVARDGSAAAQPGPALRVHVQTLTLRGLTPFAHASALPPFLRALVVGASGLFGASAAVLALLRRPARRLGTVATVGIGVAGPLAALGTLRALELRVPEVASGGWLVAFLFVPLVAVGAVALVTAVFTVFPLGRRDRS
jgi:hypothetical protein